MDPQSALAYDSLFERLDATRSLEGYFQHPNYWDVVVDDVARAVAGDLAAVVGPSPRSRTSLAFTFAVLTMSSTAGTCRSGTIAPRLSWSSRRPGAPRGGLRR